ncbi:MAG TPA: hypothetical protein VKH37_00545, partial [Ferruginibacter sp.]|nr:hypothetical protein [Ferruginibacter sp.]
IRIADSLQGGYNFMVRSTGWINCDRFANDPTPKVEFTISSSPEEKMYCAYLVFKDIKSILPGYYLNNKWTFRDVPEGKDVTLFTIGINNGKTICSIKEMKTGNGDINNLQFFATNPQDFKKRLSSMNL